jgi:aryl-alcohol dehydrogenase-like predicted oxidoreductase
VHYRELGKTGYRVSAISVGAWAMGGSWGRVDDDQSLAALHRAVDLGVNLVDTADVYGDGRSERLIARLLKERRERIYVATKAGRRLDPHVASGYTRENLTAFVERSLRNLAVEALDLLQLHCPPRAVYDDPRVFAALDGLVRDGKVRHYGVSVETTDEASAAMRYPDVASIQIIFNMFRLKPAEEVLPRAREKGVGILARVPLASGLLSGKMTRERHFDPDDHRVTNRHGEQFDRGETFSGVDFETGLQAAEELKRLVPPGATLAQVALRWILMFDAVSCAIPGARTPDQAEQNTRAADLPPLSEADMRTVQEVYDRLIRPQVHHLW